MKIHFIINPISGKGKHKITKAFLKEHFPDDEIFVNYSQYKKHAVFLTQEAIAQDATIIVACGGDGTINEIASCLVNSNIKLGIIPVGSGNGLASNLNIPKEVKKAILCIKGGTTTKVDVGKVNNNYFFSNMGFGIDALIIKKYEAQNTRTLFSYIKASLKASFSFKEARAIVNFNDKSLKINPFLLFISNSNEMGYGMSLTPKAKLSDGFLDLIFLPKITLLSKLYLGTLIVRQKIEEFSKAETFTIKELKVELPENIFTDLQIDGEYHRFHTNIFDISVLPDCLEIFS